MMRGFFGSDWSDPIEGLPETPVQSPIQDPAQEAFQFPFQYPPQDPSGGEGGQYAPVDVPENALQQVSDPFQMWNDLNSDDSQDLMDRFNPNASLLSNIIDIGKGMAEQQGFDLGVFGELNLNQSLMSNVWNAMKWQHDNPEVAWDWAGDFPSIFESAGEKLQNVGEAVSEVAQGFTENLSSAFGFGTPELQQGMAETDLGGDAFSDWLASQLTDMGEVEAETDVTAFLTDKTETTSMGKADIAGAESPVTVAGESIAATGIDMNAPAIANGAIAEAAGADVAPAIGDLLDLAAALIL